MSTIEQSLCSRSCGLLVTASPARQVCGCPTDAEFGKPPRPLARRSCRTLSVKRPLFGDLNVV